VAWRQDANVASFIDGECVAVRDGIDQLPSPDL
jgi:hypothetical protein